jgi:hypothetical protein
MWVAQVVLAFEGAVKMEIQRTLDTVDLSHRPRYLVVDQEMTQLIYVHHLEEATCLDGNIVH